MMSPMKCCRRWNNYSSIRAFAREMGDRGYQAYQEKWSEEAHLNNYFQILEETAIRKLGIVPWNGPIGSSLRFRVPALS